MDPLSTAPFAQAACAGILAREEPEAGMGSIVKGLWKRMFGGESAPAEEPRLAAVEYNGYRIRPAPYAAASGGYQTAGVIEKDFPEGAKEHRFIRAETHPGRDDAAAFAVAKGKQIIDQQGDRIFAERPQAIS
jgi:hypothetical protein